MKKTFPALIVAALFFAVGAYFYFRHQQGTAPGYRVATVERGPITAVVSSTGTLNAVITVQVGSQVSGQIKEILADFNTEVKSGQLIARIDPEQFESRVAQSQADLEAAQSAVEVARSNALAARADLARVKATLADAARDYERKKMLVEKNFISASDRDKAQTAFEVAHEQVRTSEAQISVQDAQVRNAQSVVKQREAALKQTKIDLDRTYIRAPVSGTVISRNVDAGQTVAASLQAPTLFTIAKDLSAMEVDTSVDEADVGRLRVDQQATFTVDAFPRRNFRGVITQIRKAPTIVQNVVTYTVVISADNPDRALLPGMTANVRIVVDQRDNVLKVPNAALRFRPAGSTEAGRDSRTTESPAAGPGAQAGPVFRQRMLAELNLDDAQKARIDQIIADSRNKMSALAEMQNDSERRKHAERIRAESRTQIASGLKPEQLAAFERIVADLYGGRSSAGRVWTVDVDGNPKPVEVRLGLSDGNATEIASGDLAEGREIIIGFAETGKATRVQSGPRLPF
jgi:HlyD family secretion protein